MWYLKNSEILSLNYLPAQKKKNHASCQGARAAKPQMVSSIRPLDIRITYQEMKVFSTNLVEEPKAVHIFNSRFRLGGMSVS